MGPTALARFAACEASLELDADAIELFEREKLKRRICCEVKG
jgi:hypothetical protein